MGAVPALPGSYCLRQVTIVVAAEDSVEAAPALDGGLEEGGCNDLGTKGQALLGQVVK